MSIHKHIYTFLLSTAVILTASLAVPSVAQAKPASEMNDNDKVISYAYYHSLTSCMTHSALDKDIDSGKLEDSRAWMHDGVWDASPSVNTSYLIDAGGNRDGAAKCNDLIGGAIGFWQLNNRQFLEGLEYSANSDGTKFHYNGSNQISSFQSFIKKTIYNNSNVTRTEKIEYALNQAALIDSPDGCQATRTGLYKDQPREIQLQADSRTNSYFKLSVATDDGAINAYVFRTGPTRSAVSNNVDPGNGNTQTGGGTDCSKIVDRMNQLAISTAKKNAEEAYNTTSNALFASLKDVISADCSTLPNSALQTECRTSWRDGFNKCFNDYKNIVAASGQNSQSGDSSPLYKKPDRVALNQIAKCVATQTGASAESIAAALLGVAVADPKSSDPLNQTPGGTDTTSCTIDAIGWIVCPVVNFMGGIIDGAYSVISIMLNTSPSMFNTSTKEGQTTFSAWTIMRNIANVAFVVVFLIIIFSQLTSMGITNYGIKKMLPKLVVAAILVNVSFYICAIAVDISNILGSSIKGLMDSLTGVVPVSYGDNNEWNNALQGKGGSNTFMTIIGGLIATAGIATAVLFAGLSVLLPILIGALAAVVTVVIVLTLRQALIVLLIVIAPLAFVALLLPNTEGLFKKWRGLLMTLLLMYPVIAFIFAASALAGKIVMGSSSNMLVQIMGAGVTIIPLFITPVVMKTAGGVLNRFGGVINNPNKGPFDRMRKGADGYRKRQEGRRAIRSFAGEPNMSFGKYKRVAGRKAIDAGIERNLKLAEAGNVAQRVQSSASFQNKVAGGTLLNAASQTAQDSALGNAIDMQKKLDVEEVKAAQAVVENLNLTMPEKNALEQGGAITKNGRTYTGGTFQKAALSNAISEQRMGDLEAAMTSPTLSPEAAKHIAATVNANYAGVKAKAAHLVDGNILHTLGNGASVGEADLDKATVSIMGNIAPELMATQKGTTLKRIIKVKTEIENGTTQYLNTAAEDNDMLLNVKQTAQRLKANTELIDKMAASEAASVRSI